MDHKEEASTEVLSTPAAKHPSSATHSKKKGLIQRAAKHLSPGRIMTRSARKKAGVPLSNEVGMDDKEEASFVKLAMTPKSQGGLPSEDEAAMFGESESDESSAATSSKSPDSFVSANSTSPESLLPSPPGGEQKMPP